MTEEEYQNEFRYQLHMMILDRMMTDGVITDEKYREAETLLLEKFHPVIGSLTA